MNTENFEQWYKQSKNFANPMNELNKTMTDLCRRATQEGLEIVSDNVSLLSDQMKRLSNIRKPEDYLNLTREYMTENMNASMSNVQKIMQLSMRTLEEMSHLSNNLPNATKEKATKSPN